MKNVLYVLIGVLVLLIIGGILAANSDKNTKKERQAITEKVAITHESIRSDAGAEEIEYKFIIKNDGDQAWTGTATIKLYGTSHNSEMDESFTTDQLTLEPGQSTEVTHKTAQLPRSQGGVWETYVYSLSVSNYDGSDEYKDRKPLSDKVEE